MYGAAIVVIGLAAGGYLATTTGSDPWKNAVVVGERFSPDAFRPSLQNVSLAQDATFRDIPIKGNIMYDSWIGQSWRYVPARMLDGRDTGAYIVYPAGPDPADPPGLVAGITELPDAKRIRLVMKAQNAADMLGVSYPGCADSMGILEVAEWTGDGFSNGHAVAGTEMNTTKVVTADTTTVTMDITEFGGEKVLFYGGSTVGSSPCGRWKAEHMSIETLYIEAVKTDGG
ncbi:MAG: hypothetical protein ABEK12_02990 [Candidatus Nanohaloarchaea archaeon]